MKIRFQADADLNEDIVMGVRRRMPEIDFQTANEASLEGVTDPDVLSLCARDNRILVSHDRRTMPSHFADFIVTNTCPGIFLVQKSTSLEEAIEAIILVLVCIGRGGIYQLDSHASSLISDLRPLGLNPDH